MAGVLDACSRRIVGWAAGDQDEANTSRAFRYKETASPLIADWRKRWQGGDFPFYFCQLLNFMPKLSIPAESAWAELREAQAGTAELPNTGYAVLIDIGEAGDIHPCDKKDAGERLALLPLAEVYGRKVVWAGPFYKTMSVEKADVRISFEHADGGLVAHRLHDEYVVNYVRTAPLVRNSPQSEVEGFTICRKDKKWHWANARIEGDSVVSSPEVPKPKAVRHAWTNNLTCNLYNTAGLPASPFRTDDFPLSTARKEASGVDQESTQ